MEASDGGEQGAWPHGVRQSHQRARRSESWLSARCLELASWLQLDLGLLVLAAALGGATDSTRPTDAAAAAWVADGEAVGEVKQRRRASWLHAASVGGPSAAAITWERGAQETNGGGGRHLTVAPCKCRTSQGGRLHIPAQYDDENTLSQPATPRRTTALIRRRPRWP